MPKLGLTMTEGQITEWMIPAGSPFKAEQGLFVVETDKVATEIPAEGNGVLTEITMPAGETAAVGDVIGYWQDDAAQTVSAQPAPLAAAAVAAPVPATPPVGKDGTPVAPARITGAGEKNDTKAQRIPVTPLARRMAQQLGVDLAGVTGSGPGKRIKAADVQAAAATRTEALPDVRPSPALPCSMSRAKPGSVQATMARRLTAAKQEIPHFYLALEASVSRLVRLRAELNALDGAVRFTLNHFVLAAVGRALRDLPDANRVWENGDIVSFSSTDVGMAVSTERGLFVPLVRDAGGVSLTEVARRAQEQVVRAKGGALTAIDMAGGAITVSNAGMFNVKFMTPIINPGQSMILGVGSIDRIFRPDDEGKPILQEEIGLVLAADHRLMDGVSGLKLLNRVVAYLEQPMKLLIGA